VSQEKDQMRWQDAQVFTLHQLQDRMYLHTGRKEEESSEGVRLAADSFLKEHRTDDNG
jgi:hypothetical protein